ncbi:DUF1572 family protein [Dyadobacter fanqingshengii]|uniref:DUF1572 domain-containing protein n=1 Tax=Dyadobacter fanqingshengii TaxID=2906443 RepID=A0A9X1T9F7_9BACT|nr:DUF1572 family protein [Dyadobacter fanqingshengii]MCF0040671.1 DUF1572 domain-containing protein [Dyadobacter fanqingshengii]MCF2506220.1 DUF1572 domain-containing protein [Dyadobacter fanqingshengii]USJ37591.1 DUF1572 domain-containing protein [Dyadobacter fanqingshengii]
MENEIIVQLFDRDLKKLRDEIEKYPSEESLWVRLPGTINTGGNLCQHLIGNLRTYVGLTLGNVHYVRNRDAEFAERLFTKTELIAELDKLLPIVLKSVGELSDAQLGSEYPRNVLDMFPNQTTELVLTHLLTHLSYHLGQINYHRRWISAANPDQFS